MTQTPWHNLQFEPRKWQREALPAGIDAVKSGERPLISAATGVGKSVVQAELGLMAMPKRGDRAIIYTAPRTKLVRQLGATIGERLGAENVGTFYGKSKQADRAAIVCCNASLPALWEELKEQNRKVALLVADEAHNAEASIMRETIPAMEAAALIGFTATPFRSIPKESLSLFSTVAYRYTIQEAVKDGVLVPPRVIRVEGMETDKADPACLDMIMEYGRGPGIVSAASIKDAEAYVEYLAAGEEGIKAEAIHSKVTDKKQDALIARLCAGDIGALVHVALLAEGVDFPWLRWICLRRKVQARVRFLQEIGRVLRTMDPARFKKEYAKWGPKTEGIILDPWLLLGRHGWTSAEAIGMALEEAADAECKEASAAGPEEMRPEDVVALDLLLSYLESAKEELKKNKIVKEIDPEELEKKGVSDGWRIADVSVKQVEAIKKASRLTRHIPLKRHREAIKSLVKVPWALSRGQASDLLDVLYGGAAWCRARAKESGQDSWRIQWPSQGVRAITPPGSDAVKKIANMGARAERKRKKEGR